jgi:porphobilinogen synthase
MAFPATRMRRMRRTASLRSIVREHRLAPANLMLPLFVHHEADPLHFESIPGHARLSIDGAVEVAREAQALGVAGVLLFGIPSGKDERGSEAFDDEGIVQLAVRAIREAAPDLTIATDVCMCQYTTHGHCGLLLDSGEVDNDGTLDLLAEVAVSHARAGADIVAPSDMMDGRVEAIRAALDDAGFENVAILSYSAKFASAFYGPFREAADSSPKGDVGAGDRRAYQMDPANSREALRESLLDEDEGADMLMVKPAVAYLDLIRDLRNESLLPIAAYHVSGEYAMVMAAAEKGWIDGPAVMDETLLGIHRAGADLIITYAALDAARRMRAAGGTA